MVHSKNMSSFPLFQIIYRLSLIKGNPIIFEKSSVVFKSTTSVETVVTSAASRSVSSATVVSSTVDSVEVVVVVVVIVDDATEDVMSVVEPVTMAVGVGKTLK